MAHTHPLLPNDGHGPGGHDASDEGAHGDTWNGQDPRGWYADYADERTALDELRESLERKRAQKVDGLFRKTRILYQAQLWIDKDGNRIPLEQIDARYAFNIVRFLLRRAPAMKDAEEWAMCLDPMAENLGAAATDAFDSALDDLLRETPTQWLASKPLVRALWAKVHPEKRDELLATQPEPTIEEQMDAAGVSLSDYFGD